MSRQNSKVAGFGYLGIGLTFMFEAAAFVALGWYLDGRWGTEPWLLIILTLVGVAAATFTMIRMVQAADAAAKVSASGTTGTMSAMADSEENDESRR